MANDAQFVAALYAAADAVGTYIVANEPRLNALVLVSVGGVVEPNVIEISAKSPSNA